MSVVQRLTLIDQYLILFVAFVGTLIRVKIFYKSIYSSMDSKTVNKFIVGNYNNYNFICILP